MRVSEVPAIMSHRQVIALPDSSTVYDASKVMSENNIGAVLVYKGSELAGIFTERDILTRVITTDLDPSKILLNEVMTPDPDTIKAGIDAGIAIKTMLDNNYRHLPIVDDDDKIIGMLSQRDFMEANWNELLNITEKSAIGNAHKISELPTYDPEREIFAVNSNMAVDAVAHIIAKKNIGAVPIIDEKKLVGIFTERDLMRRVVAQNLDVAIEISQVMTPQPNTISPDMEVEEAIQSMVTGGYRHLLVVEEGKGLVAILSVRDIVAVGLMEMIQLSGRERA